VNPEWARSLPPHIALTPYQVERLEIIREAVGVDHLEYQWHIRSNLECGKMLQRQQLKRIELEAPGLPPEMYFALLILQRLGAARASGGDLFDLRERFPDSTPDDDEGLQSAIFEIVVRNDIHSPDRLAEVISQYEDSLPVISPHPSTEEARRQVTLVLAESNR
jgi:hypothetical protein